MSKFENAAQILESLDRIQHTLDTTRMQLATIDGAGASCVQPREEQSGRLADITRAGIPINGATGVEVTNSSGNNEGIRHGLPHREAHGGQVADPTSSVLAAGAEHANEYETETTATKDPLAGLRSLLEKTEARTRRRQEDGNGN